MNIQPEQTWGVQINRHGYGSTSMPEACLSWVKPVDKSVWQKKGIVVWSNQAQCVEVLSATHGLQLIDYMRAKDTWKTEGIPIIRQYGQLVILDSQKKKMGEHKQGKKPGEADNQTSKPETKESFHLNPDQSAEFLQILEANEPLLQQMAKEDEQKRIQVSREICDLLLKGMRATEASKIDFSARPFGWEKDAVTTTLICNRPPNRGSVRSTADSFFWRGCIEQPNRFKHESPYFVNLEDALNWVEQQLQKIQQEPDELKQEDRWQRIPLAELIALKRAELAEYWIDPTALEPERISYQAIIDVEYAPSSSKTMEMSFGQKYHYDEKFATPSQLARELHLDPQLDVEQRFEGLYTLVSRVKYYREETAATQAQRFWEQSAIIPQHRVGKVIRAQYGTVEVETGYKVIIGACENPNHPYSLPESREEHLAWRALGETLKYALDLEGFRLYVGLGPDDISDERLLEIMHSHRAKSCHVPMEAQLESERWLRVNKVK